MATEGLQDLSRAKVFVKGEQTPVFVCFSTVIGSRGAPETDRDPRGFATRFYTAEGNWDMVGNNLPVFFIRDAMKFPDMVHSLKPDPYTNVQDPNRFFDFFSHQPESSANADQAIFQLRHARQLAGDERQQCACLKTGG